MSPAEFVGSLRDRGVVLVPAQDGRLWYRPREALSDAERVALARQRDEIMALLAADPIGWRAAVMATQVPRTGVIPPLLARPGNRFPLGTCWSCGDDLTATDRYRCGACVAAVIVVLKGDR